MLNYAIRSFLYSRSIVLFPRHTSSYLSSIAMYGSFAETLYTTPTYKYQHFATQSFDSDW